MHSPSLASRHLFGPAIRLAVFVCFVAAFPAGAQSSSPASSNLLAAGAAENRTAAAPPAATERIEYGLYVGEGVGGPRMFATATSRVQAKHWHQFAQRLKTQPFPEYPSTEPAFFDWLAGQGWQLVQCERRDEVVGLLGDRDLVTRCYFRRVASAAPAPAAGDSLRSSAPEGGSAN